MKKYIFTIFAIFLGLMVFQTLPVLADDSLVVNFQNTPLFNEASFAPGSSITKWAKVTNNSGSNQKIAVETINENDPDHLANQLNMVIKQGETVLYNDTLANFFAAGEKYLSDLTYGAQAQYDFTVSFASDTGDGFQGKTLGFDIIIGFQGQEGGARSVGGGAILPPGLTISNTTTIDTQTTGTSVIITWTTSYASTSQVVYSAASEPHVFTLLDTAKFGYAHATSEDTNRVVSHSVTIIGLTPATIYYYRTVSHGSLAVSEEHSFITKGVAGAATEEQGQTSQEAGQENISGNEGLIAISALGPVENPEITPEITAEESPVLPVASESPAASESPVATTTGQEFLASVGAFLSGNSGLIFVLAIILIVGFVIYWILRDRKKKKKTF